MGKFMTTLRKCVCLFSMCLMLVSASYAAGDEIGSAMGDRKPIITETVVSPEQIARPLDVREVVIEDGTVSGIVVNNSRHMMRDVELLIRYGWHWENEFSPGENEPSSAVFYKLPGEIAPGGAMPFTYHRRSPLPYRADGHFMTSVEVVGFTQFEGFARR